jgi:pimeloyl-ACP methyl ester carboxylesterase
MKRAPAFLSTVPLAAALLCAAPACGGDDPELRTAEANGIEIAYLERGAGPLAVLLHGFPDTPHTWDAVAPRLADAGYRVVAPYLRGYAPSGIPPADTTVETLGRDVLGLLDALGEARAVVIGHDWGAMAAYTAAALAPDRIEKLVAIAIPHPIALFRHPEVPFAPHFMELVQPGAAEMVRADDFRYLDDLVRRWSPAWNVPGGELEEVKRSLAEPGSLEAALGYYRAVSAGLPPQLLAPLPMPTLTLYGAGDHAASPVPFADQAAAFTGRLELVELPAGHFVHREAEAEAIAALLRFLGEAKR